MLRTRRKRKIVVMLIGLPIVLVVLVVLGLVGFIGVRSTEIIEKVHISTIATQVQPHPASTLLVSTIRSNSYNSSIYPKFSFQCHTHIAQIQAFYSDMPIEEILDHYMGEFIDNGWTNSGKSAISAVAEVSPNTLVHVVWNTPADVYGTFDIDFDSVKALHEIVYTVYVRYSAESCFAIP